LVSASPKKSINSNIFKVDDSMKNFLNCTITKPKQVATADEKYDLLNDDLNIINIPRENNHSNDNHDEDIYKNILDENDDDDPCVTSKDANLKSKSIKKIIEKKYDNTSMNNSKSYLISQSQLNKSNNVNNVNYGDKTKEKIINSSKFEHSNMLIKEGSPNLDIKGIINIFFN
jgi:hypothetical protein